MRRKLLGNQDLPIADSMLKLAGLLRAEGKLDEAESFFRESLAIRRKLLRAQVFPQVFPIDSHRRFAKNDAHCSGCALRSSLGEGERCGSDRIVMLVGKSGECEMNNIVVR